MFVNTRNAKISKNNEMTKTIYCNKMADIMYHINGSGRDTYIFNNNGGFSSIMHQPHTNCQKPGKFLPSVKVSPVKYPNLAASSMPKRYHTDGTGRDIYIFTNDGGNTTVG